MKVGDLVQLSAYGKKLDVNSQAVGKTGLVIRIYDKKSSPFASFPMSRNAQYCPKEYCLEVLWHGTDNCHLHVRRDLKHIDAQVRLMRSKEGCVVDMTSKTYPELLSLLEQYKKFRCET